MTASIGSILSNARSAMIASQTAINTVSHNIANAQTEGYSRKRVDLAMGPPVNMPYGQLGTGVRIQDIGRVRDRLLDITFRNQTTDASASRRRSDLLGEIQSLYAEPSANGLSSALDGFWNSWADLGNDPQSDAARMVVRQAGQSVANQLQRLAAGLDQLASTADLRMRQEVADLNQLTTQVAALNRQIVAAEGSGQTAGDLRDARDRAIDSIASLASVTVLERQDGSVAVIAGDATLVDGGDSQTLSVDTTGGTYRLLSARGTAVSAPGGSLGATVAVLNTDVPAASAELDAIAQALVSGVNALHANGTNPHDQTGIAFFDDLGDVTTVTARNLKLSDDVLADHRAIAAGTGVIDPNTGNPVYAAGANDIAVGLGALRDGPVAALGNRTIGAYYGTAVARVGTDIRAAADAATVNETLAGQSDLRRQSVSGVSIDEELVQLIRFQNAYAAAARVITAADELFQTVIGMVR